MGARDAGQGPDDPLLVTAVSKQPPSKTGMIQSNDACRRERGGRNPSTTQDDISEHEGQVGRRSVEEVLAQVGQEHELTDRARSEGCLWGKEHRNSTDYQFLYTTQMTRNFERAKGWLHEAL